jgi:hypothetical protein
MDTKMKETVGCLGTVAGLFLVLAVVEQSCSGPPAPPMSNAELRSRIGKIKAERTQRCIDNISKGYQYWPKDMQKYASGAMAKCAEDD